MKFREFTESKKTIINESKLPDKIKEIKSVWSGKSMNIWVNEIPSTGELFLELDGECSISLDKIDEFIKILKTLKKYKNG